MHVFNLWNERLKDDQTFDDDDQSSWFIDLDNSQEFLEALIIHEIMSETELHKIIEDLY